MCRGKLPQRVALHDYIWNGIREDFYRRFSFFFFFFLKLNRRDVSILLLEKYRDYNQSIPFSQRDPRECARRIIRLQLEFFAFEKIILQRICKTAIYIYVYKNWHDHRFRFFLFSFLLFFLPPFFPFLIIKSRYQVLKKRKKKVLQRTKIGHVTIRFSLFIQSRILINFYCTLLILISSWMIVTETADTHLLSFLVLSVSFPRKYFLRRKGKYPRIGFELTNKFYSRWREKGEERKRKRERNCDYR